MTNSIEIMNPDLSNPTQLGLTQVTHLWLPAVQQLTNTNKQIVLTPYCIARRCLRRLTNTCLAGHVCLAMISTSSQRELIVVRK